MFGNLGQLASLLRNAGQLKQRMQTITARLEQARFVGEAGGGQVRAEVNGNGELLEVRIDPALVVEGDVELLEDLVCAGVCDAMRKSRQAAREEMEALTGGLDVPGIMEMLGGGES